MAPVVVIVWELDLFLPMGPSLASSYVNWIYIYLWGYRGRHRMVIGLTSTYGAVTVVVI